MSHGDTTTLKLECKDGESNNHFDTKYIFIDGIYAVMAVKFDFDSGSIQDGQNARINATQNITQPEWIYMAVPTPTAIPTPTPNPNFPAVYVGNQTGQLQARFSFTYGTSGKPFIVYAEGSGDGLFGGKGPLVI